MSGLFIRAYLTFAQIGYPLQEPPQEPPQDPGSNVPDPSPDPSGVPGQSAIETILDVASWLGIVAALAAVIVGGGMLALANASANSMYGSRGKTVILSGLAGGLVVAISGQLIQWVVDLA